MRSIAAFSAVFVLSSSVNISNAQHSAPVADAHGPSYPAVSIAALHAGFVHPPVDSKPMVRWWWFGPAVVKPEIARELEQMRADGIQGAEIAFVYPEVLDDPAKGLKNLPFLSPQMLDAVHFAQTEGRRLGLRIDVTLCSGWPYGGPHITLEEAATNLKTIALPLASGATSLPMPKLMDGDRVIATFVANGDAKHWDAASAKRVLQGEASSAMQGITAQRVALFFVASHTRQAVKRAAVGADGFVLDPFSHEAVAKHLARVGEPLLSAFGATPPYAIFSDSLEAYGADWTPDLPAEFLKRRGYDLIPHLPELVAGGTPEAAKVRHDWGVTLTELIDENYLTQINDWAHAHHTRFRSQTYGEPAVSFASERLADLAEGEGPQWRSFSTLRWATSANHVFERTVTSGESFTWLHSPVFRATPLDMKAEADLDFIMGENQLIFHGWPYSPPDHEVPEPGWSLYAAAVFNDHNPWHPVMPSVTEYIARMSWLLRQGSPANQVALLLPTDDAWADFTPGKVTVTGAMQKLVPRDLMSAVLSAGYNIDFIDAATLARQGLGDHTLLLLPPTDRIPAEALRKIDAFLSAGGHAVAMGRLPGFDPEGAPLSNAARSTEGIVLTRDAEGAAKALANAVLPDFRMSDADEYTRNQVGFIRRRLSDADVYFVANTSNRALRFTAAFTTAFHAGQEWSPDSAVVARDVSRSDVRIELAPYESRVFVFASGLSAPAPHRAEAASRLLADLSNGWTETFTAGGNKQEVSLPADWEKKATTMHYSGEVVYAREFTLDHAATGPVYLAVDGGEPEAGAPNAPPEHGERDKYDVLPNGMPNPLITRPGPGIHAWYLPPIREAAVVTVNARLAGVLWHPPYRLNVTNLLRSGVNRIEIHVYNTALNAWSALPPHDYKALIAKYGDRFQMQDLNKVQPLASGILGTVKLETEAR